MPEARETPRLSVSATGMLWMVLAAGYIATSACGLRAMALAIAALMIGVVLANSRVGGSRIGEWVFGLLLAGICLYWSDSLSFLAYAPPVAGFAFMAFLFGQTLRQGSEPLITRVARKEHPDLPPDIARYTRRLTWTWVACFLLLLAVALALAPLLSLGDWSHTVQGLAIALPTLLFLGEYAYRHLRLRTHRHASLPVLILNIVAVIKEIAMPASRHADEGARE